MGFGSMMKRVGVGAIKSVGAVGKIPVLGTVAKQLPGIGLAIGASELAGYAINKMGAPKPGATPPFQPSGMPDLSGLKSAGMPRPSVSAGSRFGTTGKIIAGGAAAAGAGALAMGGVPWWQGPGGSMQLPWNDPSVPSAMKPFSLDDSALRVQVRAPRGYVVVRDPEGRPYALRRDMAIRMKAWKPAHKPPISVGDWQAIKKADRTVKKMQKIFKKTTRVDRDVVHGKIKVHVKKKGCK